MCKWLCLRQSLRPARAMTWWSGERVTQVYIMILMFCVREGDNVSLACDASGYPPPHIVWRREDGEDILMAGKKLNIVEVILDVVYHH